jgi:hypothetical protein
MPEDTTQKREAVAVTNLYENAFTTLDLSSR